MDLRSFIRKLRKRNEILTISKALSVSNEVAEYEKRYENKTICLKPKGFPSFKIVANLLNSRRKFALGLGIKEDDFYSFLSKKANNPKPYEEIGREEVKYIKLRDLRDLPIVTHYENDAGPYITSSIVIVKNPETSTQNASFHRMRFYKFNQLVIRLVEGRHLHTIYSSLKEKGKETPIAIVIGVHPAVEIAAAYQAPYGVDELEIANSLMNGELKVIRTPYTNLHVPIAEIIMEGRISIQEKGEDRMVEILGNYDLTRMQPVVYVENILCRENPIYRDILPASKEHRLLMSLPIEAKLNKFVKDVVPSTKKVILTDGGCNWLHAVVQISKKLEGDGKNAIIAAFACHPSLKLVIVVDEDIDPEDPISVEYAIATRFQAEKDLIIIKGAKGSSLDPSSDQEKLLTDKLGIDATRSLGKSKEVFERAKIVSRRIRKE